MDTTLGYILCTQSPGLFLAALMLLLFYFARRREHHVRAVMDLVLCIVCAAGGVALYFVGMGAGHFTIQDFYAIRTPGWVGIRGFLAVNRRRTAEKNANRAANLQAMQDEQARKAAEKQAALDNDTTPPEEE